MHRISKLESRKKRAQTFLAIACLEFPAFSFQFSVFSCHFHSHSHSHSHFHLHLHFHLQLSFMSLPFAYLLLLLVYFSPTQTTCLLNICSTIVLWPAQNVFPACCTPSRPHRLHLRPLAAASILLCDQHTYLYTYTMIYIRIEFLEWWCGTSSTSSAFSSTSEWRTLLRLIC